jgi:3-oxoacyl-[acyl-carrier protein] reductase
MEAMNFNEKIVVVTGGGQGIGRSICLAFAQGKAKVIVLDVNEEIATSVKKEIEQQGSEAAAAKADVSDAAEIRRVFDEIIEENTRIDILVNNAGITRDGLLVRMKEKDWDDVLKVNLKGAFNCSKASSRTMIKQRSGRIINIASVVGAMGNPGQANYVASKAGIIGLTKALAKELAPRGITVNAVAPGFIETEMTASLSDKVQAAMHDQIPLGRSGKPEDVAAAVAFLASDLAAYITGQVIHVSGGMYM